MSADVAGFCYGHFVISGVPLFTTAQSVIICTHGIKTDLAKLQEMTPTDVIIKNADDEKSDKISNTTANLHAVLKRNRKVRRSLSSNKPGAFKDMKSDQDDDNAR